MKIMLVAAVEDDRVLLQQVRKQTVQHDFEFIHIDAAPAVGIANRRVRIAENHEVLRDAVRRQHDADLVWQLEGDTLLEADTLERLIASYEACDDPKLAYVSGVQVGRHGVYMLGAWQMDHVEMPGFDFRRVTSYRSVDHNLTGRQPVDGTGFYCLLAKRTAWLEGIPTWNGEPWGPDVNFGLDLRHKGYNIYADLSVPVGHKTRLGEIWPHHQTTCNVRFYKDQDGRWQYETS